MSRSSLCRQKRTRLRRPAWPPISFASFFPRRNSHRRRGDAFPGSGAVFLRPFELAWRLAGTALGFAVFLVGGLLMAVVAFPAIDSRTPAEGRRDGRGRRLTRWSGRAVSARHTP